jgi:hypothetical protein
VARRGLQLAVLVLLLSVLGVLSAQPKQGDPERIGNVAIRVIRVPPPPKAYGWGGVLWPPKKGYYFVALRANVKNLGGASAISSLDLRATLTADYGFECHSSLMVKNRPTTMTDLLPGEEAQGDFVFTLKNGVQALARLIRRPTSRVCPAL